MCLNFIIVRCGLDSDCVIGFHCVTGYCENGKFCRDEKIAYLSGNYYCIGEQDKGTFRTFLNIHAFQIHVHQIRAKTMAHAIHTIADGLYASVRSPGPDFAVSIMMLIWK